MQNAPFTRFMKALLIVQYLNSYVVKGERVLYRCFFAFIPPNAAFKQYNCTLIIKVKIYDCICHNILSSLLKKKLEVWKNNG